MAKLSNIRMSIFYLQQAIRNDYGDDKKLLEALNILADKDYEESLTDDQRLQRFVDSQNYNNMCARATLFPGMDIEDIPVLTIEDFKNHGKETKT